MSERSGGGQDSIVRAWWTWELQLQLLTEMQQKARKEWEEEISQPFSAILELVLPLTETVLFLSFIVTIFPCNVPLVSVIFLKRSLVFPILLFSSISLHCSLRKAFLSLLALLWNSAFKQVYLSFSPLPFASLPFSAICKASSDSHFAFLQFFFFGMVLVTASYKTLQTSIHSSSGTLSNLIPWSYLSLPLYGFDLGNT